MTGYYEREGFKVCSEEFLEDGIPHVQMMPEMKGLYEAEKCVDSSQRY